MRPIDEIQRDMDEATFELDSLESRAVEADSRLRRLKKEMAMATDPITWLEETSEVKP